MTCYRHDKVSIIKDTVQHDTNSYDEGKGSWPNCNSKETDTIPDPNVNQFHSSWNVLSAKDIYNIFTKVKQQNTQVNIGKIVSLL